MSIYKLLLHDADACVRYMAKYAAKSEPRSMPVSTLFKECVEHLHVDSDPHMAFRRAMISSTGERDFSS